MPATDPELLEQVNEGSDVALECLYDRHAGRLKGLIVRVLGAPTDADDVLQETFWQIWRSSAKYDPKLASPLVWMSLIARSKAIDHLRRTGRLRAREGGELYGSPLNASLDPVNGTAQTSQMLDRLPADQQEAIGLAFYRGLTHTEIAAARGIPLGTVKTRIRNGMMRLKQMVGHDADFTCGDAR